MHLGLQNISNLHSSDLQNSDAYVGTKYVLQLSRFNTLIFCFILHLARIVGHQARAIALRLLA